MAQRIGRYRLEYRPKRFRPRRGRKGLLFASRRLHLERLEDRSLLSAVPLNASITASNDIRGVVLGDATSLYFPQSSQIVSQSSTGSDSAGLLSGPTADTPLQVAVNYLTTHAAALNLSSVDLDNFVVTSQYDSPDMGVTHIYLQQTFLGLPVVGANINVNVTSRGEVINVGSSFLSGLRDKESTTIISPALTAPDALASLANEAHWTLAATPSILSSTGGIGQSSLLDTSGVSLAEIPATLVYVPTPVGVELAWNMLVETTDGEHAYNVSVSADDGNLLYWSDWIASDSYNVYPFPNESPSDSGRALVVNPANPTSSAFGWHDTNGVAGAEFTITRGNNVYAYADRNNDNIADAGSSPDGTAALTFDFPIDLTQAPSTYTPAAVTNLFYWNNILHDLHYAYGFTEAAGNFQVSNYGHGGVGNDAVQAEAQDGGGTDNANFATPPDGQQPRMQMYEFTSTTPRRDGDLDNGIVIHEYGHGVSNRLTGGPANSDALDAVQSGGMGEGWSDWWALMLTQKSTDTKTGSYPVGTYVLGQSPTGAGIRRYPYSFNMAIDPLTYNSYNSSNEVHNAGEIWASTLWDLNWNLIDAYGYDPNLYTGAGGNNLALHLVMDALKLQPANPSFLDGRDAILLADMVLTGGANNDLIWQTFARRGMGFSADDGGSANATTVVAAFDMPSAHAGVVDLNKSVYDTTETATITVRDLDLVGSGPISVPIVSSTGDSEIVVLTELPLARGVFTGTIALTGSATGSNSGLLSTVSHGTISVSYNDANDGTGTSVLRTDNATTIQRVDIYVASMDTNPGWTIQGAWAWGVPTGAGGDPSSGHTGTNVVGYNLSGAYPNSMSATQYITTQAIDCSNYDNVQLSFWRWLGVESSAFDHANIQISTNNTTWTTIWNHAGGTIVETAWALQSYDISAIASGQATVYIRWGMGTTDSSVAYSGWNIDDVRVSGATVAVSGRDLLGTSFDVTPDSFFSAGGLVTANFSVRNLGDLAAGASDAKFYLSDDATIDPATDLLLSLAASDPHYDAGEPTAYHVPGLASLIIHSASISLVVPVADPFGTDNQYYLGMVVDADGDVSEANESNNRNRGQGFDRDDVTYQNNVASFPFVENWESGTFAAWWQQNPGAEGRIQITSANGPYQGSYHVTLDDTTAASAFSTNQLILHINLAGQSGVRLQFANKEFGDEDDPQDSVDISVDGGASWHQIVPLTGTNSTATYTLRTYELDGLGLNYSADTLIRFQQLDDYPISTDGMAFDNIQIDSVLVPGIDVVAQNLSVNPSNFFGSGGQTTAAFNVRNFGTLAAGAFDVQFYLSEDTNIDPATDLLLTLSPSDIHYDLAEPEAYHVSSLASLGTHTASIVLNVPVADPFGTDDQYYLGIVVDADGNLAEADESNNRNRGQDIDRVVVSYQALSEGFETGDFTHLPWVRTGNANWLISSVSPHSGAFSALSGDINNSQSSTLSVTQTTGVGNLTFWRKVSSESNYDYLRFYIDGGTALGSWSGELGWAQFSYPVTAGSHTFTWTYSKDGSVSTGSDSAWIDDIVVPVVPPVAGIDVRGTAFDIAPDNLFTASGLATASLTIENYGLTVAGAFDVQFYLSDDANIDPATDLLLTLSPSDALYDPAEPEAYHISSLASLGTHTASVMLNVPVADPFGTDNQYYLGIVVDADGNLAEADESNNRNRGQGLDIDDVSYLNIPPNVDGFETGDFTHVPWVRTGNANWLISSVSPHSGAFSAVSGDIIDSQSSTLSVTQTTGAGNITFWRKVSSESNFDYLRFYVDGGTALGSWSGELGWAQFSYPVTAGSHTFTWNYSKDSSVSTGSDAAWIDDIVFPLPLNTAPTNPAAVALAAIDEDILVAANTGSLVSAIVTASGSTDADLNTLGIAITAVDSTFGQWQYSANGGFAWLDISTASTATALLLSPSYLLRFNPNANFNSTIGASPMFGFKAWDRTTGVAGTSADTSVGSAFSTLAAQTTLPVTAINDAPVFNLSMGTVKVLENAEAITMNAFATAIATGPADATDEAGQSLTFHVSVSSTIGNLAFDAIPAIDAATGALTFNLSENTNGDALIHVTLEDSGSGTAPNVNTSEAQTFIISVRPFTADYNRNRTVDAADYVTWRKTLGTTVANFSGADGSGDGTVGPEDYQVWRENFGNELPPLAAAISMASDTAESTLPATGASPTSDSAATFTLSGNEVVPVANLDASLSFAMPLSRAAGGGQQLSRGPSLSPRNLAGATPHRQDTALLAWLSRGSSIRRSAGIAADWESESRVGDLSNLQMQTLDDAFATLHEFSIVRRSRN